MMYRYFSLFSFLIDRQWRTYWQGKKFFSYHQYVSAQDSCISLLLVIRDWRDNENMSRRGLSEATHRLYPVSPRIQIFNPVRSMFCWSFSFASHWIALKYFRHKAVIDFVWRRNYVRREFERNNLRDEQL
jgi:hypothetical protein